MQHNYLTLSKSSGAISSSNTSSIYKEQWKTTQKYKSAELDIRVAN